MMDLKGFEFAKWIEPTPENAMVIQSLILQDVLAAGFNNPRRIADPDSPDMVARQQSKLLHHSERYSGYTCGGRLIAFIKQNHWLTGDALPFVTGVEAFTMRANRVLRMNPATGQWGVFGLVVADDLDSHEQDGIYTNLLKYSLTDPHTGEQRTVKLILHSHGKLFEIASRLGFVPIGKAAEAAGAPGLKQQLYWRPAHN